MRSRHFNCSYTFVLAIVLVSPLGLAETNAVSGHSPVKEKCGVIYEDSTGKLHSQVLPSLHVMTLPPGEAFSLPPDAPHNVKAIQCGRTSLAPLLADLSVISAGYLMAIVSGDRVGILSLPEGTLQFNMEDGEMTEAETEEIGAFLDQGQELLLRQEAAGEPSSVAP